MLLKNNAIKISGVELIEALKEIEIVLVSLHKIGSCFDGLGEVEYQKETCRFIDEWNVTQRLAKVRHILSSQFDDELGDDDMDDIERAMVDLEYWAPNK
jgi:hypothetical protein